MMFRLSESGKIVHGCRCQYDDYWNYWKLPFGMKVVKAILHNLVKVVNNLACVFPDMAILPWSTIAKDTYSTKTKGYCNYIGNYSAIVFRSV